jgi:ribosomal protein S27AE
MAEISGHPHGHTTRGGRPVQRITFCSNCESLKSVLFLGSSGDRWICAKCRNEGGDRPATVQVDMRGKRHG